MKKLRPAYWFAAHLHVKFPALFRHPPESSQSRRCEGQSIAQLVLPYLESGVREESRVGVEALRAHYLDSEMREECMAS